MTSRPTALAAIVLALALLGDSLLYAVLPLHAATFGVSLAWAGVLLSANRIVRLFVYPFLPRLASTGLRRFTIAGAAAGAISTLMFAIGSGASTLLASRMVWGVAFGSLSLASLAYATEQSETAGSRVGLSLSLRELGPLMSLTAGTALVAFAGVRPALAALGTISLFAVAIAMRLPLCRGGRPWLPSSFRRPSAGASTQVQSFIAGFAMDGIFPATIGLLLARSGMNDAVIGAGALLAFKRIAVVAIAPVAGYALDRGGKRVTAAGFVIAAIGALLMTSANVVAGAVVLSCGAAVTSTSIPASVSNVSALARIGMARDAGAALGPLIALLLFDTIA